MAQTKVSVLPSVSVIADTDLFLLTVDVGGGLFESKKISKLALVTALGFPPSWGLTGNAGTNPITNFLGTTDARDLTIKTNNTARAWFLSSGTMTFAGTGFTANSNGAGVDIRSTTVMFTLDTIPTGFGSAAGNKMTFDSGGAVSPIFAFQTADGNRAILLHRRSGNGNGGATIDLGNDSVNSNPDGISFKTGSSTNNTNTTYRAHLTNLGEFIIGNNTISTLLGANTKAKLHVFTKGNGAGTVGMIVRNTDNIEMFKIWDNQRIVTNRSAASNYSPVGALDFYTSLLTGSTFMKMESGSGIMWEQLCNGDVVMGRGIATGSKLGIKGDGNAFVGQPTHALHVKGNIRVDGQSSNTAGASAGKYLIINLDNVAYKIALLNT